MGVAYLVSFFLIVFVNFSGITFSNFDYLPVFFENRDCGKQVYLGKFFFPCPVPINHYDFFKNNAIGFFLLLVNNVFLFTS